MALLQTDPDQFFSVAPDGPGIHDPHDGPPWWKVSVVTLGLVTLLGAGAVLGSHLKVERVGAATPTPYVSAAAVLETITAQEYAAQWGVAAANAVTALTQANLSPMDTQAMAQHAVADKLRELFSEKFPAADPVAQQQAVDTYQGIERLAQQYGVPIEAPRAVAEDAYNIGQFLLAKTAFEQALASGQVSLNDQQQVTFYCSTLFNLGWWYAENGASAATRAEGLRLLSASYAIDNQYHVGSGAAWGELTKLLGPEGWPAPAPTPLLPSNTTQSTTTEQADGALR